MKLLQFNPSDRAI